MIPEYTWNPDFSNLQGKWKLIREIGSSKYQGWNYNETNPRETFGLSHQGFWEIEGSRNRGNPLSLWDREQPVFLGSCLPGNSSRKLRLVCMLDSTVIKSTHWLPPMLYPWVGMGMGVTQYHCETFFILIIYQLEKFIWDFWENKTTLMYGNCLISHSPRGKQTKRFDISNKEQM